MSWKIAVAVVMLIGIQGVALNTFADVVGRDGVVVKIESSESSDELRFQVCDLDEGSIQVAENTCDPLGARAQYSLEELRTQRSKEFKEALFLDGVMGVTSIATGAAMGAGIWFMTNISSSAAQVALVGGAAVAPSSLGLLSQKTSVIRQHQEHRVLREEVIQDQNVSVRSALKFSQVLEAVLDRI